VQDVNWTALIIFVVLFGFITWLGFAAAHWRKGDLDVLSEWGLGGRRFGTVITWFLVGGDLYTAYTFIAVPALAFGRYLTSRCNWSDCKSSSARSASPAPAIPATCP
jgi:SSS family solute:Na+ symporter